MDWKSVIPKRFYNQQDEPHPLVQTVGELKEAIACLPDDLPLHDEGVCLVVYNVSEKYSTECHLAFEDADMCDDGA